MKNENLIAIIGITTIFLWYFYNKGKDAKKTQVIGGNEMATDTTGNNVVDRGSVTKSFKIVMPSDMVSKDVIERARELTNMRYSIEL